MGTDKIESKDLEKEELEESTEGAGQEPEQEELDLPTYIERLLQTAKTAAPSLASLNAVSYTHLTLPTKA